jgi:hypothetical protein
MIKIKAFYNYQCYNQRVKKLNKTLRIILLILKHNEMFNPNLIRCVHHSQHSQNRNRVGIKRNSYISSVHVFWNIESVEFIILLVLAAPWKKIGVNLQVMSWRAIVVLYCHLIWPRSILKMLNTNSTWLWEQHFYLRTYLYNLSFFCNSLEYHIPR